MGVILSIMGEFLTSGDLALHEVRRDRGYCGDGYGYAK